MWRGAHSGDDRSLRPGEARHDRRHPATAVDAADVPGGGSLVVVVDTVRTESPDGHVEHAFQIALGDFAVGDDAL
jgi:hypothetical protein